MKFNLRQLTLLIALGILAMSSLLAVWWGGKFVEKKAETERYITEALATADLQEIFVRTARKRATDNLLFYFPSTSELGNLLLRHAPPRELTLEMQRTLHGTLDSWIKVQPRVTDSLFNATLLSGGITLDYRFLQIDIERGDTLFCIHHDVCRWWEPGGWWSPPHVHADTLLHHPDTGKVYIVVRESVTPMLLAQAAPTLLLFLIIIGVMGWLVWLLVRQQELERTATDFTHNITHELKTPIAVALAAHESLLDFGVDTDAVKRRKLLTTSRQQLRRLSELVEQVLSVHRRRVGSIHLRHETIDIEGMLRRLQDEHELKAEKPVSIFLAVEPAGLTVEADATHLYNILSNLVDNGVKYSPLRAEIDIRVHRDDEHGYVVFSVADRGIGVARRHRRRVFEKFYRVADGDRHDAKGYGLGLFYVRTMVERHGGHIRLDSVAGRGSTFTFCIPIHPLSS